MFLLEKIRELKIQNHRLEMEINRLKERMSQMEVFVSYHGYDNSLHESNGLGSQTPGMVKNGGGVCTPNKWWE